MLTRYSFLLGCSLLLAVAGCGKDQQAVRKRPGTIPGSPPVEGSLVIVARLAEIPGTFPPNELYNYAFVMRYEVQKVLKGTWPDRDILVGHYNPRYPRDQIGDDQADRVGGNVQAFQVGDVHYLVLNELDKMWTGAVEDEPYYKDRRQKWWASWADQVN